MPAGHLAASLRISIGTARLVEGIPFEFCPPDSGAMLTRSRGEGTLYSTAPLTITLAQKPSSTPCSEKPAAAISPQCFVGSWVVTSYPAMQQGGVDASKLDLSQFVFTFGVDGSISGIYGIVFTTDTGKLTVHVPFATSAAISPSTEGGTIFKVERFVWDVQKGGSMILTANGRTLLTKPMRFTAMCNSPESGRQRSAWCVMKKRYHGKRLTARERLNCNVNRVSGS